jgi:hypothetical protein
MTAPGVDVGARIPKLAGAAPAAMAARKLGQYAGRTLRSSGRPPAWLRTHALSTPTENLTVPPGENLTDRRGDEPYAVGTS